MIYTIFNFLAQIDPQTRELTLKVLNKLLPILYSLSGIGLTCSFIIYGIKIHTDPENRGTYIHRVVWCVIGCAIVLSASVIGNIIYAKLLGII